MPASAWLGLTHGVGPKRGCALGVMLLDLGDPSVLLAAPPEPLLVANSDARHGYVRNVVYSRGALAHDDILTIPLRHQRRRHRHHAGTSAGPDRSDPFPGPAGPPALASGRDQALGRKRHRPSSLCLSGRGRAHRPPRPRPRRRAARPARGSTFHRGPARRWSAGGRCVEQSPSNRLWPCQDAAETHESFTRRLCAASSRQYPP
jgi:hypothetical protein